MVLRSEHERSLQCSDEALHTGVIPAVHCAAHGGDEAVLFKQTLITRGGIRTAAVRVVEEPHRGNSVRQRHRDGLLRQVDS